MDKSIQHGYILLADISGFDAYIAKAELEHAQGVITELLELIVGNLSPLMHLASLEGDAALTYASDVEVPRGETILELLESTYVEFRDRLESIYRNNTCNCRACQNVPSLDLKFFVHYGEYIAQPVEGGGVELGGLDANLIRERLLKDQVTSMNGKEAFILFTGQGLERIGLEARGMVTNCSSYPYLGEIRTAQLDLKRRYQERLEKRRSFISNKEADFSLTHDFDVPNYVLWDWLNDPEKRSQWMKWRRWSAGIRPWGRIGVGARNHCAHGLGTLIETILDWRPYKYFTVESRQDSIGFSILQSFNLPPLSNGTQTRLSLHSRLQKVGALWMIRQPLNKVLARLWKFDYERLEKIISENGVSVRKQDVVP
jgi:hypothetical protein